MTQRNLMDTPKNQRMQERKARNKEILDLIKVKCRQQGGACEIGHGFVVVDTKYFQVKQK